MEYYLDMNKNEIVPFTAPWMDLRIIKLNEINQKEKDKCHMISLYMWHLNYDTDELIYDTETD